MANGESVRAKRLAEQERDSETARLAAITYAHSCECHLMLMLLLLLLLLLLLHLMWPLCALQHLAPAAAAHASFFGGGNKTVERGLSDT